MELRARGLFVGEAQKNADNIHVDVNPLANTLRRDGVSIRELASLAIAVHTHEDMTIADRKNYKTGWHRRGRGVVHLLEGRPALRYRHALHVTVQSKDMNRTLWHEAGHLRDFLLGQEGIANSSLGMEEVQTKKVSNSETFYL